MNDTTEKVMTLIRRIYSLKNEKIPLFVIYSNLRGTNQKQIRSALIFLKDNNYIRFDTLSGLIEPILSDDEIKYIESKGATMDEIRVKSCIRVFFKEKNQYPTSSEIVQKFIEIIGIPNRKDPDRYVRELAEEGKLKRTEDMKYYFNGLENPQGVGSFI